MRWLWPITWRDWLVSVALGISTLLFVIYSTKESAMSDVLIYAAVFVYFLAPIVVCALKGKWWTAGAGVVFHIFPLVGAFRLAKPKSTYARRWYNDDMRAKALARFPKQARKMAEPEPAV
jgi:hypothetical protein